MKRLDRLRMRLDGLWLRALIRWRQWRTRQTWNTTPGSVVHVGNYGRVGKMQIVRVRLDWDGHGHTATVELREVP